MNLEDKLNKLGKKLDKAKSKVRELEVKYSELGKEIEDSKPKFYIGKVYKSTRHPTSLYTIQIISHYIRVVNITFSHIWQKGTRQLTCYNFKPGDYITYEQMKTLTGGRQDEFYLAVIED